MPRARRGVQKRNDDHSVHFQVILWRRIVVIALRAPISRRSHQRQARVVPPYARMAVIAHRAFIARPQTIADVRAGVVPLVRSASLPSGSAEVHGLHGAQPFQGGGTGLSR